MNINHLCLVIRLLVLVYARKPSDKDQQAVWRLECELGVVTDDDCPIDGAWAPWSPWTACSGPCDNIGRRSRYRECNNPFPTLDGLPCAGVAHQTESCYITNCTLEDYRKLVTGDPIRGEALRILETVPTITERCFTIECPFEAIEASLEHENTWQISSESLWNALLCVKHNQGCLVVGEWGPWGEWSPCGARCGHGLRWRTRKCDMPPPSSALLVCTETPLQVDECQGNQCAVNKRDSGGNWSKWGPWSECSESCGIGVRHRKRTCIEINTIRVFGFWGTHCRGQHDQIEVCENKKCKLDGEWSGWGEWGPCSQTCGAGRRSRSRSCSRPEPAGSGKYCTGQRTELGSCHLKPCQTFAHTVAVFNGESFLNYDFKNKRSTFFHFYIRFLPLSPHGTLVRRGDVRNSLVRLSLQKWHVCLDAGGLSNTCTVSRLCSRVVLEPAQWHTVLITVTSAGTTLRLDDEPEPLKNTFSCDPELPNEIVNVIVGERLHGEVQELILNFISLCMELSCREKCKSDYCPRSGSNIAYESAGPEESFLTLVYGQYVRLPCVSNQDEWQIKLTLKPQTETGIVLFMPDPNSRTWILLYLQNMKIKLKLAVKELRAESTSSSDCPPDRWLDVILSKTRGKNAIEAVINTQEHLHVLFEDGDDLSKRNINEVLNDLFKRSSKDPPPLVVCVDEYFFGGIPNDLISLIANENVICPLTGVLASVTVNNDLLDLKELSVERCKDDTVQVSSRAASVSGLYYETAWGKSERLNLTCLHTRFARSLNSSYWLHLDSRIISVPKDKSVRSVDDGRVLKLMTTANNDVRGFYTCRALRDKRYKNIVTYGVLGQTNYKVSGPDLITSVAVITTLFLVLGTLSCLFLEGIYDIRNGFGFYRDAHFTPEEEAEAICDYIDQNMHLMTSEHAAEIAKARARRRGRQMAKSSTLFEKPEDFEMSDNFISSDETNPALSEIKSSEMESKNKVFLRESNYASSPRCGSISSTKSKPTMSLSPEVISPRVLCSKLVVSKRLHMSKSDVKYRKKKPIWPRQQRSELLTIKSMTYEAQPIAQMILQKFQELKTDDIAT